MLGSMVWGMLTSVGEWLLRPPVIIEPLELSGRTFVLTGGTDGQGAMAARRLAADGARLVLGVRNLSKGEAFAAELRAQSHNELVEARYLHLANLSSVVEFAQGLAADEDVEREGLHALLNNAGSLDGSCAMTTDGFEAVTQVNYLAPVLLTRLLLPLLERSGDARVVFVSCPAAAQAKLDLEQLQLVPDEGEGAKCDALARYGGAKLMLHGFSAELSRRRRGAGMVVTSNVFDPVAIDTDGNAALTSIQPPASRRTRINPQALVRKVLGYVLSPLLGPLWRRLGRSFMRGAHEGGHGLVHVATSRHLSRVSGRHFTLAGSGLTKQSGCTRPPDQCGRGDSPAIVSDAASLASLWEETHVALEPWSE